MAVLIAGQRLQALLEHKGVQVDIESQGGAEALNDGHGAALAVADALARGGAPQPAEDDTEEHGEYVATEGVGSCPEGRRSSAGRRRLG